MGKYYGEDKLEGEGNDTTSNKTSNKGAFASSKINSIHISIHIYHSLRDYTSPVIRDQADE